MRLHMKRDARQASAVEPFPAGETTTCVAAHCGNPAPAVTVEGVEIALCPEHEAGFEARWHLGSHASGLDGTDGRAPRGRLV